MSSDHAEECRTCRFWKPNEGKVSGFGECLRHAPQPLTYRLPEDCDETGDYGYEDATGVIWPHTFEGDWCGEWRTNGEPPA
ncbi:MAG: hypothetical protein E6Q76_01115 [Rhizobium sp.]|nr:MAG: hypothetical protein E6Q76_01115 [Rhizobium sp.]